MTSLFDRACRRLEEAACLEDIAFGDLRELVTPRRTVKSTLSIVMDDGACGFFEAWHCRHRQSGRLSNGGLELGPDRTMEDVEGHALLGTLRSALFNLPFDGCAGAIRCDPTALSRAEMRRLRDRYAERLDSWIRPGGRDSIAVAAYLLVRAVAVEFGLVGTEAVSCVGDDRSGLELIGRLRRAGWRIVGTDRVNCGEPGKTWGSPRAPDPVATECALLVLNGPSEMVDETNAALIKARVVVELAEGAISQEADAILHERGVVVVPDLLVAGGGALERHLERKLDGGSGVWTAEQIEDWLTSIVVPTATAAIDLARKRGISLRQAVNVLALRRLLREDR